MWWNPIRYQSYIHNWPSSQGQGPWDRGFLPRGHDYLRISMQNSSYHWEHAYCCRSCHRWHIILDHHIPGMPTPPGLLLSAAVMKTLRFAHTRNPLLPSQCRQHIHDVIMAGDGPSVLLTSDHVIPVLIEHKVLASTLRACNSMSMQKWDRRPERLIQIFTEILPMRRVSFLCGRKLARKASGIKSRCNVFSLREGSTCIWESLGGFGK